MRPVFVREMKELSPALVVLLAAAVIAANIFTGPLFREFDDMLAFPIVAGLALGVVHAMLDRWRRGDLFALHRPIPAARMEAARSLAGVAVMALGLLVFVVAHRIATLVEMADRAQMDAMGIRIAHDMPPEHVGAREIALVASFLFAAWAVARFATGAVRLRWALPALVAAPLVCWSLLAHTAILVAATGLALLLAALFSIGGGLCLAGDRQ